MANEAHIHITMDHDEAKKTVFVFIPGAWHLTNYLDPIRNHLSKMGLESVAVSHQTLDPINPGSSVFEDAAKVEKVVKELLNAGKNVVVVMHSYGGSVGSQAIGSLLSTIKSTASQDKDKASKMGKVLHLVYVAAIIPQVGETSAMLSELMIADNDNMDTLPLEFVDGKMFCKEEIKELFYGDLPASERDKYYDLLQGWPVTGASDALTHFGWKYVPSTYVCAVNDRIVSAKAQTRMWTRVNAYLSNLEATLSNLKHVDNMLEEQHCSASSAASSGEIIDQNVSQGPGLLTVKEIHSDHCSMFILREHVESLGSMLLEIVES